MGSSASMIHARGLCPPRHPVFFSVAHFSHLQASEVLGVSKPERAGAGEERPIYRSPAFPVPSAACSPLFSEFSAETKQKKCPTGDGVGVVDWSIFLMAAAPLPNWARACVNFPLSSTENRACDFAVRFLPFVLHAGFLFVLIFISSRLVRRLHRGGQRGKRERERCS